MLEIAVCDDDMHLAGHLEKLLLAIGTSCSLKMDIEVYHDGRELTEEVQRGKRFDIIFLDIMMKEIGGLEAADEIRKRDLVVQLVYVTSHETYMQDTFRTAPIGFLKKPVEEEDLRKVFWHVMRIVGMKDAYYRFQYRKSNYKILVGEIMYCESRLRKTEIVTVEGVYSVYRKLDLVEPELADHKSCFIRIHESYLVNYRYITRFSYDGVELTNGKYLPMSRRRSKEAARMMLELKLQGV